MRFVLSARIYLYGLSDGFLSQDYSVRYIISTIIADMEGSDLFDIMLNGMLMIRRPAINIIEADG